MQRWLAWLESEPRGDKRADHHTAILLQAIVNQHAQKPVSFDECLKMVRAPWTHLDVHEAAEAKRAYKRKARKKVKGQLKNAREQHKAAAMERKRGSKHRQTVSDSDT